MKSIKSDAQVFFFKEHINVILILFIFLTCGYSLCLDVSLSDSVLNTTLSQKMSMTGENDARMTVTSTKGKNFLLLLNMI